MRQLYLSHQQGQSSDSFLQRSDFLHGTYNYGCSRVNNRLATGFAESQLVANLNSAGGKLEKEQQGGTNRHKSPQSVHFHHMAGWQATGSPAQKHVVLIL